MTAESLKHSTAKADYYDPETWEVFLRKGQVIDQVAADRLEVLGLADVERALHGGGGGETGERWLGWGRHRTAVARVVLVKPGQGAMRVNGQPAPAYFAKTSRKGRQFIERLLAMDVVEEGLQGFEVIVLVRGSCETCMQQAHAAAHALARALWAYDPSLRERLTKAGFGKRKVDEDERFGDQG